MGDIAPVPERLPPTTLIFCQVSGSRGKTIHIGALVPYRFYTIEVADYCSIM